MSLLLVLVGAGVLDKAKEAAKDAVQIEVQGGAPMDQATGPLLGSPVPVAEVNLADATANPWVVDYAGPISFKTSDMFEACPSGEITTPVILTLDAPVEAMHVRVTQPSIKLKGGNSRGMFVVQDPTGSYYCSEISNDEELVLSGPAGEWLVFVGHNGQPNMGLERPFTLSVEDPNKDLDPDLDGSEAPHHALSEGQGMVLTQRHGPQGARDTLMPARQDGQICRRQPPAAPALYLDLSSEQELLFEGDSGDLALVGPIEGPWRDIQALCVGSKARTVGPGTWAVYPVDPEQRGGLYTLSVSSGEVSWDPWVQAFEPTPQDSVDDHWLWRVFPQAKLSASVKGITESGELLRHAPGGSFVFVSEQATLKNLEPLAIGDEVAGELPAPGEPMLLVRAPYALGLDGNWYALKDDAAVTTTPPASFVSPEIRNQPQSFKALASRGLSSPASDAYHAADAKDSECRSVSGTRYRNATEGQILTQAQSAAASKRLGDDNAKCSVHARAASAAKEKAVSEMQALWQEQMSAQHASTVPEVQTKLGL